MDERSPDNTFELDDAGDLKKRSARGSFATLLSQGVKLLIQIASQVVLARLLFPAEFGLLAMAFPIVAFVQVFNDIGLGQAIIQRPVLDSEQMSALFWINLAISFVLAGAIGLLSPIAGMIYGEPRVVLLMTVLGLTLPVAAISISPSALLARQMRFGVMARNEVVSMFIGSAVTILCALKGLSYWSLVMGQFASAVAGLALVWTATRWRPSRPRFNAAVWDDVKFGGNITLSNLATFATTSGDNVIVGVTVGKVSLGLYDRSYNLVVRPVSQLMAPLSRVAVPLLSRLLSQADEYKSAYLDMVSVAALVTVPAMLVCVTNASTVVNVLLGHRWRAAIPIFAWICVGGLTAGIYSSASWLFVSQDRTRELRFYSGLAAVLNIASYLIGAIWGVVGIAASASIGFVLITTPLMLLGATLRGPVNGLDLTKCLIPFLLVGVIVYLVLIVELRNMLLFGLWQLVVATILSYGLFIGLSVTRKTNRRLISGGVRLLWARPQIVPKQS